MVPVRRPFASLAPILILGAALSACGSSSSAPPTPSAGSHPTAARLHLLNSGVLTVGSDTTYPPMESADPNNPGTFIGADVDLAQALAKQMGLKGATIKNAGFDSLIPSLNANRFDAVMSSMNDTPERRKSVEFVDYMTATEAILVKKSAPIRANSYSGLCGKSVAVERGTTEQDGLNAANQSCSSKINIQAFPGDSDAYQAFKSGHTDAYTSDLPVIAHYVSTNPGVYQMAGKAMSAHANYGIAVRKGNTVLKNALSSALAKLRANGQYMKILKKWNVADAALKS